MSDGKDAAGYWFGLEDGICGTGLWPGCVQEGYVLHSSAQQNQCKEAFDRPEHSFAMVCSELAAAQASAHLDRMAFPEFADALGEVKVNADRGTWGSTPRFASCCFAPRAPATTPRPLSTKA